jgi:uncharacterized protein YutE (UPF0331/DUF86 family)
VKLDKERLDKYLDQIASETIDIEKIISQKGKKLDDFLQDTYILKSLKYSIIVIAEAIASTLQHVLAKKHNIVIDGYMAVFSESKEHKVISIKLLTRLQPFFRFRNMLVHQYWRVDNEVFVENLRNGLNDFRIFVNETRKIINEDSDE